MKMLTIRLKEEEHKKIKKFLIDKNKSFQEYVLELIKEDMKKNNY